MIKIKRYPIDKNGPDLKIELLTYLFEIDSVITYPNLKDIKLTFDECVRLQFSSIKTSSWFFDLYGDYWIVQADEEHEMFLALKYPGSTVEVLNAWDIR